MVGRLAAFFPLADPLAPIDLLDVYAGEGVDYVEFGWPANNPYLDGPDVRDAMKRAGARDPGAALISACGMLAGHGAGPRALLMAYAEPEHPVLADPSLLGAIDALLVVAPAGDAIRICMETLARASGVGVSSFLALPLAEADIAAAARADGYVMLQAAPGVTGPRTALDPANATRIGTLRASGIAAPILLGFGISNGAQARAAMDLGADGVVVGSAVLRAALQGHSVLALCLKDLRNALNG
jgi:tryptophan synthase alpha chain